MGIIQRVLNFDLVESQDSLLHNPSHKTLYKEQNMLAEVYYFGRFFILEQDTKIFIAGMR